WYTNATVSINHFNNVTKYYPSQLKYPIYFVPFYFDIKYTDMGNCRWDTAANGYKYSNYEVMESSYR
ncbi:MAG: hypothetical protein K2J20_03245, partial [Bacilli bacterium]|nr:hypothetical protein [Bacilli bacterium]